jgi:hypothetical protein
VAALGGIYGEARTAKAKSCRPEGRRYKGNDKGNDETGQQI